MELGYQFQPAVDSQALGHPCLDVNLYHLPTGEHFDPRLLNLPICESGKGVQSTIFSHPAERGILRVAAGQIVLVDFSNKEVEAFSFGGYLEIEQFSDHTACRITSNAPIFDMGRFAEDEAWLISEYEGEIARLRARWPHEELDFDQRLAETDPKILFIALTAAIDQRQKLLPVNLRLEKYWEFQHWLHAALHFIEPDGKLPPVVVSVDDLIR